MLRRGSERALLPGLPNSNPTRLRLFILAASVLMDAYKARECARHSRRICVYRVCAGKGGWGGLRLARIHAAVWRVWPKRVGVRVCVTAPDPAASQPATHGGRETPLTRRPATHPPPPCRGSARRRTGTTCGPLPPPPPPEPPWRRQASKRTRAEERARSGGQLQAPPSPASKGTRHECGSRHSDRTRIFKPHARVPPSSASRLPLPPCVRGESLPLTYRRMCSFVRGSSTPPSRRRVGRRVGALDAAAIMPRLSSRSTARGPARRVYAIRVRPRRRAPPV